MPATSPLGLCVAAAATFGGAWCALGGDVTRLWRLGRSSRDAVSGLVGHASGSVRKSRLRSGRRARMARDMPVFLDILNLGLSAGLSFDSSLELYCMRYETELATLLRDALLSWQMGVCGRGEALEALARDVDMPAMARFAATVSEALAFGTPLSEALGRQAQVIRDEQRAQVEEQIEHIPVKMLIPLGTLIVPAMLLAILGPLLAPAIGMA